MSARRISIGADLCSWWSGLLKSQTTSIACIVRMLFLMIGSSHLCLVFSSGFDVKRRSYPPYWAPQMSWEKGPGNIDQLRKIFPFDVTCDNLRLWENVGHGRIQPTRPQRSCWRRPCPRCRSVKATKEYKDGPSSISMINNHNQCNGGDLQVKLNVGDVMTGVHGLGNDVLFQVPDDWSSTSSSASSVSWSSTASASLSSFQAPSSHPILTVGCFHHHPNSF